VAYLKRMRHQDDNESCKGGGATVEDVGAVFGVVVAIIACQTDSLAIECSCVNDDSELGGCQYNVIEPQKNLHCQW
jgi:hypothetical protein